MLEGKTRQLAIDLSPSDPFSWERIVPHSGIAEAYNAILDSIEHLVSTDGEHCFIVVYGRPGVGKTHLLEGGKAVAISRGLSAEKVQVIELCSIDISEEEISKFISVYEQVRSDGGVLLLSSPESPAAESVNPHLRSRLLNAQIYSLEYPTEEELEPLLRALIEKNNLKLSDFNVNYLLKRLPLDPLSFDNIFAKISRLSLSLGRPAKLDVIKKAVSATTHN